MKVAQSLCAQVTVSVAAASHLLQCACVANRWAHSTSPARHPLLPNGIIVPSLLASEPDACAAVHMEQKSLDAISLSLSHLEKV